MLIIKKHNQGFTLIEMMVVVSIVSFLSSTVLGTLNNARIKTSNTTRAAVVKEYKNALELVYDADGDYPIFESNGCPAWSTVCLGGYQTGQCQSAQWTYCETTSVSQSIERFLPARPSLKQITFDDPLHILGGATVDGPFYRCETGTGSPFVCDSVYLDWYLEGGDAECGFGLSAGVNSAGSQLNNYFGTTICMLHLR